MLGDEVSEFIIGSEQDIIGLGNLQPDGLIKVNDMVV